MPDTATMPTDDRSWMVVDAQGRFMTQRQWPTMAPIRTALDDAALRLDVAGMPTLFISLAEPAAAGSSAGENA